MQRAMRQRAVMPMQMETLYTLTADKLMVETVEALVLSATMLSGMALSVAITVMSVALSVTHNSLTKRRFIKSGF